MALYFDSYMYIKKSVCLYFLSYAVSIRECEVACVIAEFDLQSRELDYKY